MGVVVTGLKIICEQFIIIKDMEVKVQDGDIINVPHGLKPIIKDTYITFKKQPVFKNGDVLVVDSYNKTAANATDYMLIYNGVKEKDGYGHHIYMDYP